MTLPVYPADLAIPLRNDAIYAFLRDRISRARRRVWASVFIVNVSTAHDTDLRVREMLKELAFARWRAVDVRVLLGRSVTGAIEIQNGTADRLLRSMGVEARVPTSDEGAIGHSKYVIIDDDWVVVGSNNWSPGGFGRHHEDAMAVRSAGLSALLSPRFTGRWSEAGGEVGP